jgi:CAAX prenyl protease-like protein
VTVESVVGPPWLRPLPWVLPFAVFVGLLAAAPLAQRAGVDPRDWYAVRTGVALLVLAAMWRRCVDLHRAPDRRSVALGVAGGGLVLALWLALDQDWASLGAPQVSPFAADDTAWWQFAARIVGAVIVAPLAEELFFRSFLMRWLVRPDFAAVDPRAVDRRAFLIQAALFASMHQLIVAGFAAGLVYGWLYRHTGSLWPPVLAHALTNALLAAWVLTQGAWHLW